MPSPRCELHGKGRCLECGVGLHRERPSDKLEQRMNEWWKRNAVEPEPRQPLGSRMYDAFRSHGLMALVVLALSSSVQTALVRSSGMP